MRNGSQTLRRVLRSGSFDSRYVVDVFYDGQRRMQDAPAYDVTLGEDGTSKVQQSGSLTIIWQDPRGRSIAPQRMEDLLSPFGTTLVLYMIVDAGPVFSERVTMGTFIVSETPSIDTKRWSFQGYSLSKGDRIRLSFKDAFYKVQRNRFDTPGVTPSLSSVYTEIQRLTRLPVTRGDVTDGPIPRALVYEEDRLDAVYELATARNATPYMTSDGTVSLRPYAWGSPLDTITADDAETESVEQVPATYTPWVEQRRNVFPNPRAVPSGSGFGASTLGNTSWVTDMPGGIRTARRWQRSGAGNARAHGLVIGTATPAQSAQTRVRIRLRASAAMSVQVALRNDITSGTNQSTLGQVDIPAGVTEIDLVGPSFAATAGASSGVALVTSSGAVGDSLDVTAVDVGLAPGGDRFDGWSAGDTLVRHRFLGVDHQSASVREARQVVTASRRIPLPPARGTLVGISRGMSAEGVYNRVVVRAQGADAKVLASAEITEGVLRAENAGGSDSPFGRVPYFISSQFIVNEGQALDVVRVQLPRVGRPQAIVLDIEETVNPLREVGDVLRVQRSGESFLARVQSIKRGSAKTQMTRVVVAA